MYAFRKNILVLFITFVGVLGLLNVSIQFGRIVDCFPGISLALLLAEEITETEGSEKNNESFSEVELFFSREDYILQSIIINDAAEVYLHSIDIPAHPAFEKATPPPKA